MLVRRPWWCVDQEVVERRPEDRVKKLSDHGGFFGTAPDDGGGARCEEEGEGHSLKGTYLCRLST